jgi:PKD repeat protein
MRRAFSKLLPTVLAVALLSLSLIVGAGILINFQSQGNPGSAVPSNSAVSIKEGTHAVSPTRNVGPDNGSATSWTYVTRAAPLRDPSGGTMTYDSADGYVLWYGGGCGGYGCNQTVAFQNGSWRNIRTAISPTAQMEAPMVYDAADGYVLLQGGTGYNCYAGIGEYECNETWEYKSGAWTELHPRCYYLGLGFGNCSLPAGYHPMVYDAATGAVFLDGGSLGGPSIVSSYGDNGPWIFKNDTWTYLGYNFSSGLTISNPTAQSLVYDAADGYVMAFGGESLAPSLPGNLGDNYTWVWSNNGWTNISANVTNAPPPRISTAMVYDATDGYVLLYGGRTILCDQNVTADCDYPPEAVPTSYADTWKYLAGNWTEVNSSSAPGYVPDPLLTYDPVDRGVADYNDYSCTNANLTVGCTDASTWLWGAAAPIGNLSIEARNAVDIGVSMNLSATFDGGTAPFTIQWAFGDGQYASGKSAVHTYTTAGNFTVVVWVNDSQGYHAVASTGVVVYAKSLATAYAYPNPTDVGLGASFFPGILNGSPPQYTFNWSFGDGGSTGYFCPNPCGPEQDGTFHTYAAPGLYSVRVLITYASGGVYDTFAIRVNPNPILQGVYAAPNPALLDEPVNFIANLTRGTAPFTYSWAFGDGGTGGNLSEIAHIYTTDGPFDAVVRVADAAGFQLSTSLTVTIALNASVTGNVSIGAAPLSTYFQSQVTGGVPAYTYIWQFGDGNTSSIPEPTHVYAEPGTYTASLIVADAAGHTDFAHWTLEVFPGGSDLNLQIRTSSPNPSIGETTTITLSPSGGVGGYTLAWLFIPSSCAIVSPLELICDPSVNGTYTATGSVTDSPGATATANASFTVGGESASTHGTGGGRSFLGLLGNDGVYLILGLVGGVLLGVISAVAISRRAAITTAARAAGPRHSTIGTGETEVNSVDLEDSKDPLRDLF